MLSIDWQQPWFKPWAVYGEPVLQAWQQQTASHPTLDLSSAFNQCHLSAQSTCRFSFVPQSHLPVGVAYETHVFQQRQIPTRNNAHDFFNGLCWLRFGQTKAHLNQLQANAIASQGVSDQRGALRDALTLFDENAALLCAPPMLWQALQQKQWHELFITHRDLWLQSKLILFGHALLEKWLLPYKGITAHVLNLPAPAFQQDDEIDAWLCQTLSSEWIKTKPFVPLPLAGVPGWWEGNDSPAFIEDKKVFRD